MTSITTQNKTDIATFFENLDPQITSWDCTVCGENNGIGNSIQNHVYAVCENGLLGIGTQRKMTYALECSNCGHLNFCNIETSGVDI